MNKKRFYITSSTLLLIGLFAGVVQYVGMFDALYAAATNPGHSWNQMECSTDLCVTSTGVGIGTASPTAELHVEGNIIASDPTAANHVATMNYVDGKSIPSGMIAMFDASCPTGWTRFSALDNHYPRGASTYGTTGNDGSHIHDGAWGRGTTYMGATANIPYINVIWCKKN